MSYMYALSRLRAMENRFLDAPFFSRLMESATIDDAVKSLSDTVYGRWLSAGGKGHGKGSGHGHENFDKIIEMEMVSEFDEVASFVPDKEMLEIIRMPYDFNNVKVALKSVFRAREGGERRHDLLTKLGAVDPERVILAVEGEEYDLLPYGLWHVLPQCRSLWEQTRSPRDAELLLDDCMFKAMLQHARKLGMPGLTSWVRLRIDAENITTAMRLARMKFDQSASLKFFHDGGTISPQNACRLLAEPVESWSKVLSYTPFGALLEADPKSPPSAPTSALRGPGYTAEGVVLHLLMKEAEARSLRLALVCVANGLNRDAVRRLMSHGR